MKDIINVIKFKGKVLTPVHIGAGENLEPMNYVVSNKELFVINLERLLETSEKKFVDAITSAAKNRQIGRLRALIKEAFESRNDDTSVLRKASASEVFLNMYQKELGKQNVTNALEIKQHISTMGKPYIPGSSLKGAIRTGILELIFNSNTAADKQKELEKESNARKVEAALLGCETSENRQDISRDPFKLFKPRDSFLPECSTEVCVVYNKNSSGKQKGIPIITETVKLGTEFEIEIALAEYGEAEKKQGFKKDKFLMALKFCSENTKKKASDEKGRVLRYSGLTDSQKRNAKDCYDLISNDNKIVLRIGFGSGYDFTTVKGFRYMKEPKKGKPGMGWGFSKNLTETGMPLGFISLREI